MTMRRTMHMLLVLAIVTLILPALPSGVHAQTTLPSATAIDIQLPSDSADGGNLAVRLFPPTTGRYDTGAPIVIWVTGGTSAGTLSHALSGMDDTLVITFMFPGGTDEYSGLSSDGVYDYRGEDSIAALRDVVLYAAGEMTDADGNVVDDVVTTPLLHDNIGLLGVSNGGNIVVAAAALHGAELNGYLRYIIQWESPVSSQMATVDLGPITLPDGAGRADFINPHYLGYDPLLVNVDYSDIYHSPSDPYQEFFLDGTGDGSYSLSPGPGGKTPDINGDGVLSVSEDWPLSSYPGLDGKLYFSRPVAQAMVDEVVFMAWPSYVATVSETMAYWDIREAVRLYDDAVAAMPDLEAMVLCSDRDHVQSMPTKPHVRQALEGWDTVGAWVQLNPSPMYLKYADTSLVGRQDLPINAPNTAPSDWADWDRYSIPVDITKESQFEAACWQMADRAQGEMLVLPAGGQDITYVESEGRSIAVRIRTPQDERFSEGAPVVVNVPGFFTGAVGFGDGPGATEIGAVQIDLIWPGREDADTNASSQGMDDFGGPLALTALRDVVRFALGLETDINGWSLDQLTEVDIDTSNVGLYAFSHPGLAATNLVARHGDQMPGLDYFVGRENPTQDATCPLETGHYDEHGVAVHNPFYQYPQDYDSRRLAIDYSTVTWMTSPAWPEGRPVFMNGADTFVGGEHVPQFWGKRTFSMALTQALLDNGALSEATWPADLSTVTETLAIWPARETVYSYPDIGAKASDLKVMLVFADRDHVQSATDKPHIHQAWDGFRQGAGLWARLNPDSSYVLAETQALPPATITDHDANTEPVDWIMSPSWGHASNDLGKRVVPLAGLAEMMDRTREDDWSPNLDEVLVRYPAEYACALPWVTTSGEFTATADLVLPHDVDRLRETTLICDGGRGELGAASVVYEIDYDGNVVWSYAGDLEFAHNADRLVSGNTLISDTGNDRVIEVDSDGNIVWNSDDVTLSDGSWLNYPNDVNLMTDDTLLITDRDNHRALRIDRDGNVLWQFGETGVPGSDFAHLAGPHNADMMDDGNVIIVDSVNNRIVEVDPSGLLVTYHQPGGDDALSWPRDADRLDNGNTLVVDSLNNRVIEFEPDGDVAWEYGGLNRPYDADRLPTGNTLISSSLDGVVLEVDAAGSVVWRWPTE